VRWLDTALDEARIARQRRVPHPKRRLAAALHSELRAGNNSSQLALGLTPLLT